ncbi:MAG: hypothetical protein K9J17_06905 [Flavobacteriales bacterium]|nr:hypothetical protein [Flavobacteriales bacterium]
MNRQVLTLICTFSSAVAFAQNVGIGNTSFTPNTDALLELRSTTSGFLLPKMTQAQMNAISGPTEGLIVYQTNATKGFKYYNGTVWTEFGGGADNFGDHIAAANIQMDDHWLSNDGGSEGIRIADDGNVGIGVAVPLEKLHVGGKIIVNDDIYDDNGNIRMSGEDDVYITMDYNNNDSDTRAIRFGKNSMTSPTELMRISESGNVGIGTATPNQLLHLQVNNNGMNMPLFIRNTNGTQTGGNGVGIGFNSEGAGDWMKAGIFHERIGNYGYGKLHFMVSGTQDNQSLSLTDSRMTILPTGSIGMGTTNPDTRLHIYGNGTSGVSLGGTTAVPNPAEGPEIGFGRGGFSNPGAAIQMIDYDSYSAGLAFLVKRGVANGAGGTFADNFPSDVVQALTIINTGNIGVGTSNPVAKLHVSGDARISDLAGSGTRMVVADANGDLSTQAIPGGGSSLWSQSGSNVYRSSGKVGIGTSSPSTALHVISSTSNANVMTLQSSASNGWSSVDFMDQSGSLSATFGFANSSTSGIFTNRAYMNSYDHDFVLTRNSTENSIFISGSSGNIGFGNNNPQATLHVSGDARITDLGGSGTRMVVADANGDLSTQAIPSGGSSVWSQSGSNVYRSSGKVGIGTSSPSTSLHVSGDARISDLAGSGTRMVVASSNGTLSTQTIPSGGSSGTTLSLSLSSNVTSQDVSGVSILEVTYSNDKDIRGLSGGVDGQIIYVVNTASNDKVEFKKNQGTQQFIEDFNVEHGEGAIIMFMGSKWYRISS